MALPSGYTQLQYIESTGTQYINTGFVPNQDTRAVCDAQFTDISGTVTILGQRYTSAAQKSFTWISVSGNLRSYYHSYYGVVATSDKSRHVYELDKNKTIIDGNTVATWSYASFTADFPIFIFANNEQGTASFHAKMKLYACRIYNNGTLVRDYVPCVSDAEGVGLYDLVNNRFYGNDGTGTFTAGSANPNPTKGYTELEYIQSSGGQYINTGFIPNSNTRVVADLQIVELDKSLAANAFWGARTSSESKGYGFQYNCNASQLQHFHGGYTLFAAGSALYNRQIWEQNKNVLTGTGVSHTANAITFQCEYSLYLFAMNDANSAKFYGRARLYSCQIYDNGTLVRDFVPKMRVSDGAVGLYDLVNDVFYTNAGSGTFSYGLPEVTYNNSALIDGTKYNVNAGKALIGGTAYSIAGGKTLVDGTAYEIVFSRPVMVVNITGTGHFAYCYVTINGTNYYETPTTIECEAGTSISCTASGSSPSPYYASEIYVNGSKVSSSQSVASYTFAPTAQTVTIRLGYSSAESTIYITM